MASLMQQILETYRSRIETIRVANEFATDAGMAVFLGEIPQLGPDDPSQAIAIVMGEQAPTFVGENVRSEWPIEIHGLARSDLDEPWMTAVQIASDIVNAIELPGLEARSLGGLVKPWIERRSVRAVEREAGSTTVAVAVTYMNPIVTAWGYL